MSLLFFFSSPYSEWATDYDYLCIMCRMHSTLRFMYILTQDLNAQCTHLIRWLHGASKYTHRHFTFSSSICDNDLIKRILVTQCVCSTLNMFSRTESSAMNTSLARNFLIFSYLHSDVHCTMYTLHFYTEIVGYVS